ncbi:hypothetical protein P885DRAFT_57014 [Corynascus similis CBS 632.67]
MPTISSTKDDCFAESAIDDDEDWEEESSEESNDGMYLRTPSRRGKINWLFGALPLAVLPGFSKLMLSCRESLSPLQFAPTAAALRVTRCGDGAVVLGSAYMSIKLYQKDAQTTQSHIGRPATSTGPK